MARYDVEAVHTRDGWRVQLHGTYATQEEAWAVARWVARRLGRESFLRALSGRWRKRDTFPRVRDPRRTKG